MPLVLLDSDRLHYGHVQIASYNQKSLSIIPYVILFNLWECYQENMSVRIVTFAVTERRVKPQILIIKQLR